MEQLYKSFTKKWLVVTPIFRILRIQFVSDIFLPGSGYHVTGRCGCARWSDLGMGLKHGFCCLKKKNELSSIKWESQMKVLLNEGFLTYSVSEAGNPGNEQGPGTGQNDNDARTHTEPYWNDRQCIIM